MNRDARLKKWRGTLAYYQDQLQTLEDIDPTPFDAHQKQTWLELIVKYQKHVAEYQDLVDYLEFGDRKEEIE